MAPIHWRLSFHVIEWFRKNGELRGYDGGLWRKQFLLDHEGELSALGTVPGSR